MQIRLPAGIRLGDKPKGPPATVETALVAEAGISALDYPGMRCQVLVEEGQQVEIGTPVLRDRRHPALVITSPVAGVVGEITLTQRRFFSLAIQVSGNAALSFDLSQSAHEKGLRDLLLNSGMWPSFRARPFSRVPNPESQPAAIFVTAIDNRAGAADPSLIVADRSSNFAKGVMALRLLTAGPVYVCQSEGADLLARTPKDPRIVVARFGQSQPEGLPGTHIARLFPASRKSQVWHIGYQDVIALGLLLRTGKLDPVRVVQLCGTGLRHAATVKIPWGADLHALARQFGLSGPKHVLSGAEIGGREAQYLGRLDVQASIAARAAQDGKRKRIALPMPHRAVPQPFIPSRALEQSVGPGVPVVPLLRALSIGDVETAERLGCVQLAEEDLALASHITGGETDFGARLRAALDVLEGQ